MITYENRRDLIMSKQPIYSESPRHADEPTDDVEVVPTGENDRRRQALATGTNVVEQTVEADVQTYTGSTSRVWREKADAAQLTPDDIRRRAELYASINVKNTAPGDIVRRFTTWYESGLSLNAASRLLGVGRDAVLHAVEIMLDEQLESLDGPLYPEKSTPDSRAELLTLINQHIVKLRNMGVDSPTVKYIVTSIEPDVGTRSRIFSYINHANDTTPVTDLVSIELALRRTYGYLLRVAKSPLVQNSGSTLDTEIY